MAKIEKIIEEAITLVKKSPEGIRWNELQRHMQKTFPDIPHRTIHGALLKFRHNMLKEDIYLPARGLYKHIQYKETTEPTNESAIAIKEKPKIEESYFYQQFADWLVNDLSECTRAIPLGGSKFKDKWGTPDVIGIREARKSDIVKPPTEVISAEIKTSKQELITAFGQACAYKLFSHRSYIVVPKTSSSEDIDRLDSLARIFGIGLILFDHETSEANFEIRVRAALHEPDYFYLNQYLKQIENELFK